MRSAPEAEKGPRNRPDNAPGGTRYRPRIDGVFVVVVVDGDAGVPLLPSARPAGAILVAGGRARGPPEAEDGRKPPVVFFFTARGPQTSSSINSFDPGGCIWLEKLDAGGGLGSEGRRRRTASSQGST